MTTKHSGDTIGGDGGGGVIRIHNGGRATKEVKLSGWWERRRMTNASLSCLSGTMFYVSEERY